MADFQTLLNNNQNISVQISLETLLEGGRMLIAEVTDQLRQELSEANSESHVRTKKACEILDVSPTTIWRLEKSGKLHPLWIGGEKRYKMSELKAILEGK